MSCKCLWVFRGNGYSWFVDHFLKIQCWKAQCLICYVEFLGDGESKAHSRLLEEAVCDGVQVEKLECVGHVQRRLGSCIRSLFNRLG